MSINVEENFLKCVPSLKPKKETGVTSFLAKYPENDGSAVTIAILDSGVCCLNADLRITPDGSAKVVERFDCSGGGDISLKEVTANNGIIVGQSGRNLKLSEFMKTNNKNQGSYRVGLKCIQELFPSRIRERESMDIKLKEWDEPHKKLLSETSKEISDFELRNPGQPNLNFQEKFVKENLEAKQEFLNMVEKKFMDVKTSYDIVAFETTDEGWICCVDTTETGDLQNAKYLREYSRFHEVVHIAGTLSVSFNFHDKENIELVGICSSHGTHVSSIAAGYNQEDPESCGIAVSAKIVSLTIGDSRLGSMETGTSLVRAIIKIMKLCEAGMKIDIVNMSYGEHSNWSNSGRIGELLAEVVNKYGVVWVVSAGNHGPALSTIGTPPDFNRDNCLIGVGAYVSPDMMESEYILRQKLPGNVYTWTSRDPCIDGGNAVTVCAPGAAIATVPEFTNCKSMLMNGTSMASPHVAGALALILSGLKKLNIVYTPYSIKRAIENTALKISYVDEFAQGSGLLCVEKLFDYLVTYKNQPENQIKFTVTVGNSSKGIHIRSGHLTKPHEYNVTVEPLFFNEKFVESSEKVKFNIRLTLVASESWVSCGTFIDMCYCSRTFTIKIDPTGLPSGVHTAKVLAFDSNLVQKGIVFQIPITVVQPNVVNNPKFEFVSEPILFRPNTIIRDFILVPNNATYAVLEMISADPNDNNGGRFLIHTMQILPDLYCKALETQKILPVGSENFTYHPFKVKGNNILEVCIAKYWSNFGDISLKYRVKFHGFQSNNAHVMLHSNGIHRIDVTSLLSEEFLPAITLKNCITALKPSESKILPLTQRDVIPKQRQIFNNQFVYNLHINKSQEVAFHFPLFYSNLYEAEFESQFFMVFDANKMMVCCFDAYSDTSFTKLDKGDYTIKLQVRHEKKEYLEKISEAVLLVTFKLQNAINLEVFKSFNNAITQNKKITSSFILPANRSKAFYISPLQNEKITKNSVLQSSYFEGNITFTKEEFGKKVDVNNFKYIFNEAASPKKPNGNNSAKENKSKLEEYKEALRDFQNSMITKLDCDEAENLYKEILEDNKNFHAVHLSLITVLEGSTDLKQNLPFSYKNNLKSNNNTADLQTKLHKIIDLANAVIAGINQESLLAYFGLKTDTRQDATKQKQLMEKQKIQILEAFVKKAVSIGKLALLDNDSLGNAVEELDNIMENVIKYVDFTDSKVLLLSVWHGYLRNEYGRMLKYLQKLYEDKLHADILEEMKWVTVKNEWTHIEKFYINKIYVSNHPANYRPF